VVLVVQVADLALQPALLAVLVALHPQLIMVVKLAALAPAAAVVAQVQVLVDLLAAVLEYMVKHLVEVPYHKLLQQLVLQVIQAVMVVAEIMAVAVMLEQPVLAVL
jgi:hypothetical protein